MATTKPSASTTPMHMPEANATGNSPYRKTTSEFEDVEGRGYLRREESYAESTSGPDVEMRSADEITADAAKDSRNRRLTLMQLERFRRAIAHAKNRKNSSTRWEHKARRGEGFDSVFAETVGDDSGPANELKIVSYPLAMWVLGALIIIAASIFVDQIHRKAERQSRLSPTDDHDNWWKYLIAGLVYVVAALVIVNGRVETFTMNRELSLLTVRTTKPLCLLHKFQRTRVVEKELRTIIDVRVEASGEILSGEVDTRAYKIHFDFDDDTHTTTLESRSKSKAAQRCRAIKHFLLSCAPSESPTPRSPSSPSAGGVGGRGGGAIVLPVRPASGNLTLAVPAPPTMPAAAQSQRRIMMVAAVPTSTLAQRTQSTGTPTNLPTRSPTTTAAPTHTTNNGRHLSA